MPLSPGSRLGSYEIVSALGAGGMGEVYRARDSKLKREVAIKVLPGDVANDRERLARFQREAEVLASLNHPNIAHIHGLEESGGTIALVMELVEGEDLAERIVRGAVPLDEALPIARQIAEALEAAHEQGIIHRDLKPANIKVRHDGTVKVLDFGLAKALDTATGSRQPAAENPPTITTPAMTMHGMILGTAAYMAPEQARGKVVDRRADIWSFGCVLYQLVTGRRAFDGEGITEVLARLLERDPDWSSLSRLPLDLQRLLARCLAKDPKSRLRDIGEARIAIDQLLSGKSAAPIPVEAPSTFRRRSALWSALPWSLVGVLGMAAAVLVLRTPPTPVTSRPIRVELALPIDVELFSGPSLAANGSRLAFVGVRQGIRQVYVRSLEDAETRPVVGTDTGVTVALSPDGGAATFVANDTKLKHVNFASGIVETLADGAAVFSGPAWLGNKSIVFSRGARLVIRPLDGVERELAVADAAAGETALSWPVSVADANLVLFVSRRKGAKGMENRLEAVSTDTGIRRAVLDGVDQALFAIADRLVFARGGALYTVPFDVKNAAVRGVPTRLGESVTTGQIGGLAASVADSGAFVAAPTSVVESHLVWITAAGVERPILGAVRGFENPRVSPDGRLIAFSDVGTIWTLDPERGAFTRVSSDEREPSVGFPMWSPDGRRIYYRSAEGVRHQSADGEGPSTLLPNTGTSDYPNSITADGSTLVLLRLGAETGGDLFTTPATGGELKPLLVTSAYEGGGQISPDGKWLLYVSNESGRMEVMLRPIGGPDRKWPVSSEGGIHALWSHDGRRIYYRSGQQLLAVDLTTTPEVHLSRPQLVFEKRLAFGQNLTMANFSLSKDGREFLMVQLEPGSRHLNLVLNWVQALGK